MSSTSLARIRRRTSRSVVTCGSWLKTFSICTRRRGSRAHETLWRAGPLQLAASLEVELDRHPVPPGAERWVPARGPLEPRRELRTELLERQPRPARRQGRERGRTDDGVRLLRHPRPLLFRIGIAKLHLRAVRRHRALPCAAADAIGGHVPAVVSSTGRRMAESTYRVVPAVDKAARLLAELRDDESLGISELARRITASKGTVRDILLTLASHDLVTRDLE